MSIPNAPGGNGSDIGAYEAPFYSEYVYLPIVSHRMSNQK